MPREQAKVAVNQGNSVGGEVSATHRVAGTNISSLKYADDTTLMAESKEKLKSFQMRVKDKSEKASFFNLKLNIKKKTKIMASSPITSWQVEGGKVEKVTDFLFLSSKITVDSDCSHEIRKQLLLGRKAMTNLNRVLKIKDITYSQGYGLSSHHVQM